MRVEWYEQMSRPECKLNGISIYIYILLYFVYMYICIYVYKHINIHISRLIKTYTDIYIYVCVCIGRYVCNTSCITQQPLKSKQTLRYMRRSCIYI